MGPLEGVKIIEVGGIGPGPFCGMMLSDMGADIVRIERMGGLSLTEPKFDVLTRNRRSVFMDLRKPEGLEAALKMVDQVVDEEHSHVLSSAWAGGANYILSLDRDSFLLPEQRQAALPSEVRTPQEFIREEVPV